MTTNQATLQPAAEVEVEAVAEVERTRILTLLDDLISHYAGSHHPGLSGESRASVLKALRLLKGRITSNERTN